VISVSAVEKTAFAGSDADNDGHYWVVVDSGYCPWGEVYVYDDGSYGDAMMAVHGTWHLRCPGFVSRDVPY
jgi:hypothetical protein